MARVVHWWSHSKTVALIWLVSATIFFILFQMALRNSNSASSSDSSISNQERRSNLYDGMARDLDEHGAKFLKHGETSQSLSLSDIFTVKDGSVEPVLKAANPPVRANVLYMRPEYSVPISEAVKRILSPYFEKCRLLFSYPLQHCFPFPLFEVFILVIYVIIVWSFILWISTLFLFVCLLVSWLAIWFQNSSLYHFSMFHASHHITPVPATEHEIEAEATAVGAVSKDLCPLKIVLDRVVLTSTGVLLGCWQVISGTDPITIRAKLKTALPHAPEKQLYDAAILHTSFARLLGQPKASAMTEMHDSEQIQFFHELVARLNNELHGFEAVISELWYVEEYDVLALALNGRMHVRKFQLGCHRN